MLRKDLQLCLSALSTQQHIFVTLCSPKLFTLFSRYFFIEIVIESFSLTSSQRFHLGVTLIVWLLFFPLLLLLTNLKEIMFLWVSFITFISQSFRHVIIFHFLWCLVCAISFRLHVIFFLCSVVPAVRTLTRGDHVQCIRAFIKRWRGQRRPPAPWEQPAWTSGQVWGGQLVRLCGDSTAGEDLSWTV